jgi:hypothetical protein
MATNPGIVKNFLQGFLYGTQDVIYTSNAIISEIAGQDRLGWILHLQPS